MNEIEEKIKKLIDSLSKEELLELRKQIMDIFYPMPIIKYSESIKENFLKRF